jgi:hypothetical protein
MVFFFNRNKWGASGGECLVVSIMVVGEQLDISSNGDDLVGIENRGLLSYPGGKGVA